MSDRLPNGLTPEQDAAFDRLAEAIADYWRASHPNAISPTPRADRLRATPTPGHLAGTNRTEEADRG